MIFPVMGLIPPVIVIEKRPMFFSKNFPSVCIAGGTAGIFLA